MEQFRGTTILSARRGHNVALGGDGQVTLGNIVIKSGARQGRRLDPDRILAGFAIGSGGPYAQSAARALLENTTLGPKEIVAKSLGIAADICIYTNQQQVIETLE